MKKFATCFIIQLLLQLNCVTVSAKEKSRSYYQITVYHFASVLQEQALDTFLKNTYLPALHRIGIATVGVFKPIANDTAADKLLFLIVPFPKPEGLLSLPARLQQDEQFVIASGYYDTSYQNPSYLRMENMVLQAFPLAPVITVPKLSGPVQDRVYELRSYESATEKLHCNKVQMFNEGGETTIFTRLQFNPVFYASVVAGSHMPNLMYLTSFENKAEREAHWKAFGEDAAWKALSALPEYQHNVSKITIWFLRATNYSDY